MLYGDGALISLTTLKSLLLNLKLAKKQQYKNISLVTKNDEKTVPYEMYYFFPPTDLKIQFFATANWSGRY